jgi:hypothetical protein
MNLRALTPHSLAALSLVAVLAACGSEEAGPKYASADAFCTDYATTACKEVTPKCSIPDATCQQKAKAECNTIAAGAAGRTFSSSAGEACVGKLRDTYAKQGTITGAELAARDEACQRAFQGSGAKLGTCKVDYDCSGSLICDKTLCADKVQKNLDDLCGNPGEVCAKGSYCTGDAVKKCTAKRKSGEACDATKPCAEDLRCLSSICSALVAAGEKCTASTDCATGYCDVRLGTCSAGIALAAGATGCDPYK